MLLRRALLAASYTAPLIVVGCIPRSFTASETSAIRYGNGLTRTHEQYAQHWSLLQRPVHVYPGRPPLIVELAGWGKDESKAKSADAGFDPHWVKPVHLIALKELLDEMESVPKSAQSG